MNKIIDIATKNIVDWDSFHETCKVALGFPEFYGRNGNAWIDCLFLDGDGMSVPFPPAGGLLVIQLKDCIDFLTRCPEQFKALMAWTSAVNDRRREDGNSTFLAIMPEGYSNSTMT